MKVNYNIILRAYESSINEIDEIMTENSIAMEASTEDMMTGAAPNGQDQTNNETSPAVTAGQKSKIVQMVQKIIDKIKVFIERAKMHIANKMKLLYETDRGYMKNLERAKGTAKPLKGFKAIVYTYDNTYLESTMAKVLRGFIDEAKEISTKNYTESADEPVPSGDEVISKVLGEVAKNKDGITVQSFSRELIDTVRGEKKEGLFNQSQIPVLERTVTQGASKSAFADYMAEIDRSGQALESKKAQLSRVDSQEEIQKITKAMSTISQCYSAATTLCKIYYELKVEQYLSAREVLRQFYQF